MMRTKATLRIMGAVLDPEKITQILGIRASEGHRSGDPHHAPGGRKYSDHREGLWALSSSLSEASSPDELVNDLLDKVRDKFQQVRNLREVERADIFLGAFLDEEGVGAFSITSETIARLAAMGLLTLEVDLYCTSTE